MSDPRRYRPYSKPRRTARQKVLKNIVKVDTGFTSECWLWQGRKDNYGYGKIRNGAAEVPVHWILKGYPPEGLEVDHLCKQRNCVNPDHLEYVTHAENIRRRDA